MYYYNIDIKEKTKSYKKDNFLHFIIFNYKISIIIRKLKLKLLLLNKYQTISNL